MSNLKKDRYHLVWANVLQISQNIQLKWPVQIPLEDVRLLFILLFFLHPYMCLCLCVYTSVYKHSGVPAVVTERHDRSLEHQWEATQCQMTRTQARACTQTRAQHQQWRMEPSPSSSLTPTSRREGWREEEVEGGGSRRRGTRWDSREGWYEGRHEKWDTEKVQQDYSLWGRGRARGVHRHMLLSSPSTDTQPCRPVAAIKRQAYPALCWGIDYKTSVKSQ